MGSLVLRAAVYRMNTRRRAKRAAAGLRYAVGLPLSEDAAQAMFNDVQAPAGWHVLDMVSIHDAAETAAEEYANPDALAPYLPGAVAVAANRYECDGEGRGWVAFHAVERAAKWAESDGVALLPAED